MPRSQTHPLAPDTFNQRRVAKPLGVLQFIFPKRERLHQNTSFKQYVEGDARHVEGGGGAVAMPAPQHHCDVGVTVGAMGMTGATTKKDAFAHRISTFKTSHEGACGVFRFGIERRLYRSTPSRKSHFSPVVLKLADIIQVNRATLFFDREGAGLMV